MTSGFQQLLGPQPPSYDDACWDTPAPSTTRLPNHITYSNTSHTSNGRGRSGSSLSRHSRRNRAASQTSVNAGHNPRDPVVLPQTYRGWTYLPPAAGEEEVTVNVVPKGSLTSTKAAEGSSSSKGPRLLKSVSSRLFKSLSRKDTQTAQGSSTTTNSSNRRRTAPEIIPQMAWLQQPSQQQQQLSRCRTWHGQGTAGTTSRRQEQAAPAGSRAAEAWRAAVAAVTVSRKATRDAVVL